MQLGEAETEAEQAGLTCRQAQLSPELRGAVGVIAELTVALHASEQARKAALSAPESPRKPPPREAGAANVSEPVVAYHLLGPRAAALRLSQSVVDGAGALLDMGVSGFENLHEATVSGVAGVASAASQSVAAVAGLGGGLFRRPSQPAAAPVADRDEAAAP
jgi:hypothetical protein